MYTSPRTSRTSGTFVPRGGRNSCGIERIVATFGVTFSPTRPSPRVAA
jgi:hypothetical protein